MKQISIQKVLIKNFRSYKDETVELSQTVGLKLISGINKETPRLGANGCGKSSLWEAITWCFYGSGIKGAKTSSVLSWNEQKTEVCITLLIGKDTHIIKRYGPPERIELDNKLVEQVEIETLIGLSRKRFLHSIIFGQGVPLFPDLPVPERGVLLDEVLDLTIWNRCTESAGVKHKVLEGDLNKKKSDLAFIDGKISSLPTDSQIQEQIDTWEEDRQARLAALQENLVAWEHTQDKRISDNKRDKEAWDVDKQKKIDEINILIQEWKEERLLAAEKNASEIDVLQAELLALPLYTVSSLNGNEKLLKEQINSYDLDHRDELKKFHTADAIFNQTLEDKAFWDMSTCPVCNQPITKERKERELSQLETKKSQAEANRLTAQSAINVLLMNIQTSRDELQKLQKQQTSEHEQTKAATKEKATLQQRIDRLQGDTLVIIEQIDKGLHPYTKQLSRIVVEPNPYIAQEQQLQGESNPFITQFGAIQNQRNPFLDLLGKTKKERQALEEKQSILGGDVKQVESSIVAVEYWKHGFKRIRLFFVQQILAALQIEIQSAISSLGLEGWSVGLATEQETKSGTMKLGVQLTIKSPKAEGLWEAWSGGEAQRLRLAIAMGLASLIQRAAGSWFNFCVMDEPTSWLSQEGIEDLLSCLEYWSDANKKSVWVVDHRALTHSGFQEIWTVIKDSSGNSKVYKDKEAA